MFRRNVVTSGDLRRENSSIQTSSSYPSRLKFNPKRTLLLALPVFAFFVSFFTISFRLHSSSRIDIDRLQIYDSDFSVSRETLMQQRFGNLPTPPWPQLDNRISLAILHGEVIGFDTHSSTSRIYNNTIVTAYYQFTSKHSTSEYKTWFGRILRASEPMIIFLEPGCEWVEFVRTRRAHAPTIIAKMKFDELVMSSTFTEEFWDYMHQIDIEKQVHKGTGVYKIWNEKFILLYASIMLNPFNSPFFAWMDAGYFRNDSDAPRQGDPIIQTDITARGVPEGKILVLHIRNDDLAAPGRVNVAGNAFYGTAHAFLNFYNLYYKTFWDWCTMNPIRFIGSDQFVITEACRRYKTNCHPYFPGKFKKWFALSKVMKGEGGDISQVSSKYLFLAEPPKDITQVPVGEVITYCKDEIKPLSQC